MTVTQSSQLNKDKYVSVWALLTVDEWLDAWVGIWALLRDVEVTGELVRELQTHLADGALGTQRFGVNAFVLSLHTATHIPLNSRHTCEQC